MVSHKYLVSYAVCFVIEDVCTMTTLASKRSSIYTALLLVESKTHVETCTIGI